MIYVADYNDEPSKTESEAVCVESNSFIKKKCHKCKRTLCAELNGNGIESISNDETYKSKQQYNSISLEIDGQKIDLQARKKNFKTPAAKREAKEKAFIDRIFKLINEMHELITEQFDPVNVIDVQGSSIIM